MYRGQCWPSPQGNITDQYLVLLCMFSYLSRVEIKEGTDWTYIYSPCTKVICEEGQGSRSRVRKKHFTAIGEVDERGRLHT